MDMFCFQCEQAARGKGCDYLGICGKEPEVAALQDLIIHQAKGIGYLAHQARRMGCVDDEVNHFTLEALFTTVTNVNFDPEGLVQWIREGSQMRNRLVAICREAAGSTSTPFEEELLPESARFRPASSLDELLLQATAVGLRADKADEDIRSLKQLLLYGLKGLAAYAEHAYVLGRQDDLIFAFIHEALAALNDPALTTNHLLELSMRCGQVNLRCMEILDQAHTGRFGHPVPTPVPTSLKKGAAIIVTGHDLLDLEALLEQTEGTGINVYTHGEMLPAHGYPGLKKYRHLAGHFGTAWQNQQVEFDNVPAAILFTTNCIQQPRDSYKDRTFTTGLVAWPGVAHVANRDFGPVIKKALSLEGFQPTEDLALLTGCGHQAVLGVADKVVAAVKSGAVRHFFLVGGCDGARPGRNYYTELARQIPKDCVILTLACGKFRFNHLDFGTIGGIPRLLDIGQCNDAHSAIVIAKALAGAFNCSVNDLPLSLILSWYEQKAVVILLSLLSLGIKGMRLGPTLPAFLTPNVAKVLVDTFDLKPITTPSEDLAAILG
jgi:hydroxylamine reductase